MEEPWKRGEESSVRRGGSVQFQPVDVVVVSGCWLAVLLLAGPAWWVPGAGRSACLFALLGLGPLVLRTLAATFPRQRLLELAASFWLLPVATLGHGLLGPLVDWLTPVVRDGRIAQMDERLFGFQPAVVVSSLVPAWLNEVLMVCYYGHFVWPLALGVVLYWRAREQEFEEYQLALGLLFAFNFTCYALVPVVGPRYFLHADFPGPLSGLWVTPLLDSVMRLPQFARDCFPSGHTGTALLVGLYAWRFARRLFWAMVLPLTGLVLATVTGRFHYVTDLLCALPLVGVATGLAMAMSRAAARRQSYPRSVPVDAVVRS